MLHARFYSVRLIIIITIIILSFVYPWQYFITLKQIIQIKLNRVKNPNWPEANHFAIFTSVVEDLNSGLPWTNLASGQIKTWTWSLRIASPVIIYLLIITLLFSVKLSERKRSTPEQKWSLSTKVTSNMLKLKKNILCPLHKVMISEIRIITLQL